jgi:hypothetical protein
MMKILEILSFEWWLSFIQDGSEIWSHSGTSILNFAVDVSSITVIERDYSTRVSVRDIISLKLLSHLQLIDSVPLRPISWPQS